jgi:hypothetical protein
MSTVQQVYESLMDRLTPKERLARSVAMLKWSRDLIARRILETDGPRSFERLKWEVALLQYGSVPEVRFMIERALDRVSD